MVFSSLNFIFIFLPLFLFAYYVTPAAFRNSTLFAGSILFYAAGVIKQPYALFLLMVLTYLNYVFGICLYQIHNPRKKKLFLTKVIFFDFLWLFLFKYSRHLSLPLGISFYTFQLTAYLFDIYYGRILPERDFVTFGTYISMFPKLISGPITPYEMLRRQLHSARRFLPENLAEGMKLFIRGLGLKAILANQFGSLWANVGTIGYESISTPLAWLGIYAYSFQIYFDFSGYSDMAIGLGAVLGFHFPENFNYPYIAASVKDFWHRWHISLSTWFKEYVYIPLGGSRCSRICKYRNIMITFLVSGMWHGAGLHYLVWGGLNGFFQVCEDAFSTVRRRLPCKRLLTFIVASFTWVFFRAESVSRAVHVCLGICRISGSHMRQLWEMGLGRTDVIVLVIAIAVLIVADLLHEKEISFTAWLLQRKIGVRYAVYLAVCMVLLLQVVADFGQPAASFLYFQF